MCKINKSHLITAFVLVFLSTSVFGQDRRKSATIAFYNVENLFDTIVSVGYIDGTKNPEHPYYHIQIPKKDIDKYEYDKDFRGPYTFENIKGKKVIRPLILQEDEFSPKGTKVWGKERYERKLHQLAKVINEIGRCETNSCPVIVVLSEVETFETVEDLANQPILKPYNYGVIHFNSFDARGIDLAFLYQQNRFRLTVAKAYPIEIFNQETGRRIYTRDIIRITGFLDGEEMTFLVNHWPSRFGGEKRSQPNRMAAAKVMKDIFDEIRYENPDAKIIAMGDFNDDPEDRSIAEGMGAVFDSKKVEKNDIYNPMVEVRKKTKVEGTLAYRDAWNLFDPFLVTGTLVVESDKHKYKVGSTKIFAPSYLRTPDGPCKGFPYRMFGGDTFYPDGYSDHFPVYMILVKDL